MKKSNPVKWDASARKTSSARTLEPGTLQFQIFAVTRAKMMRDNTSSRAANLFPDIEPRKLESQFWYVADSGKI